MGKTLAFPVKFRVLPPPSFFRIHFSYTDTANTEKMARYLGERWEKNETAFKRSYMSECHLCDEYLYLPIPIKNDAHTFRHIIFFDNAELKYRVGQPEGNFRFVFCRKYLRT